MHFGVACLTKALSASGKRLILRSGSAYSPRRSRTSAAARTGPIPSTRRNSASEAAAAAAIEPNRASTRSAADGLIPGTVASTPAGEATIRRRPRRRGSTPRSARCARFAMRHSQRALSAGSMLRMTGMPWSTMWSNAPRTPEEETRPTSRSRPSTRRYARLSSRLKAETWLHRRPFSSDRWRSEIDLRSTAIPLATR